MTWRRMWRRRSPWLYGLTHRRGVRDLLQSAGLHVVDVSVDRDGFWNQRMVADTPHIGDDCRRVVLHREPVDELTFRRAWALADIAKAGGSQLRGLEALGQETPHQLVGEEQHSAVRMMNDEELLRAEELVGNDQRAEGVVTGAASRVANDVGIALRQPRVLGGIQPGVHAREDRKATRRRQRQLALLAEVCDVGHIRRQDFSKCSHRRPPWRPRSSSEAPGYASSSSMSQSTGSCALQTSFSIRPPHAGQQNCRNWTASSMKRCGSPMSVLALWISRSMRRQWSL